ncbi:AraC family transcriptional regulator [Pseudomonas matsuisoli]|uniref:Transcriptional regulator n=1 Tax=Pseudomonas matsuisoli TaxID=1515666 RepID=A0A917Q1E7_9PSED|nr:AraC family transcriptional regulator [Pseudomonas matsuisoli]GGK06721.1 transcriptional regulator [Pseudomonas matsuisoli]
MSTVPMTQTEALRAELSAMIARAAPVDGTHQTVISSLSVSRCTGPSLPMPALYQPCLCLMVQGRKQVWLGEETYVYGPLNYLVASVTLPVSGQVIDASPEHPYLSLKLDIDPATIASLIDTCGPISVPSGKDPHGLFVDDISEPLLDAVVRLMRLIDSPRDAHVLAPLAIREIFYRVLRGAYGYLLRNVAIADSQTHRISRAIEWINRHFDEPLSIDALAQRVNLSPSSLHHRFKALTAMSPLQYQKQLRLQEARRLMINDGLEAAAAGYRVGYESPSQFSREYARQFGAPPARDIARWRNIA